MHRPMSVLLALLLVIALAPGAIAKDRPSGPKIKVVGSSFSESLGVTSSVLGRLEMTFNAKSDKGKASGTLSFKNFGCLTAGAYDPVCGGHDTTLHQTGFADVAIDCLVADATTHTVWFSGKTLRGIDLRQPLEGALQEQYIINAGDEITYGRLQDVNGDGSADLRSLLLNQARKPYPNALSFDGAISSTWFQQTFVTLLGGPMTSANTCRPRDAMYLGADYTVITGSTNSVDWLDANTQIPLGSPVLGDASHMANPPSQAVYDLSSITRTLGSSGIAISIH